MGQLLDKLEQASRGASQPLGFGRGPARPKIAPLLLLGAVDPGDNAQTKLAGEADLDAVIVLASKPAKKADIDRAVKALKQTTVGVWREEAQPGGHTDADFQVFSSEATPIGALGGEDRTNVMQIVPEADDSLLRTIEYLPVDAFLVSLTDADSLTVSQLMRLGACAASPPGGCWPNSRRCPPKTNSNSSGKSAWPGSSSGSPDAPPPS